MGMIEQQEGEDGWQGWLDGGEKRKREIETICWGSYLLSFLMSPIRQIDCLFPTGPRHFLTLACYPAEPLPCFLFVVSFSNFPLPSSFPHFVFKRRVVWTGYANEMVITPLLIKPRRGDINRLMNMHVNLLIKLIILLKMHSSSKDIFPRIPTCSTH